MGYRQQGRYLDLADLKTYRGRDPQSALARQCSFSYTPELDPAPVFCKNELILRRRWGTDLVRFAKGFQRFAFVRDGPSSPMGWLRVEE